MNIVRRSILGLLVGLGLVRAAGYFAYAAACLPSPLETFHLEAKMVLLAYRAELGESLYPPWRDYPHVTNFYGPAYFWAVGQIGRAFGSDIPGLFRIGRAVSFGSALLTSMLVGVVVARRYGRGAGVAGAVTSLGAAPMIGFSVMTRPDLMAEFLGVAGFFLAVRRPRSSRVLGVAVLALAALTKQTAAIFLLAASLARALDGEWRRGLWVLVGGLSSVAVVVASITLLVEPNFARSLVGDSMTPWDASSFAKNLGRIVQLSPDILYFPALGLALWASGATGGRAVRPAVLTALLLAASVGLAAKRGADLNYYLSLRVCEGLAVGALWRTWSTSRSGARSAGLALAALLGCATMLPGARMAVLQARGERSKAAILASPQGQDVLNFYRDACSMAREGRPRLLTDSGMIDLFQGTRAAFGDPYLFRIMAETGQVDLSVIGDRIDSQYYDYIITTSELDLPSYDSYEFGLPVPLIGRARAKYVRVGSRAGLFLYRRRPGAAPAPVPSPGGGPRG